MSQRQEKGLVVGIRGTKWIFVVEKERVRLGFEQGMWKNAQQEFSLLQWTGLLLRILGLMEPTINTRMGKLTYI